MSGRYLLDTNVVIALFAGEPWVAESLGRANEVFLPSIVLGELYFGAMKSSRSTENVARVSEFADTSVVVPCDELTAIQYAGIKADLRGKGQPIPENDIWVAAIARQHGLILASRDEHFNYVEGLQRQTW